MTPRLSNGMLTWASTDTWSDPLWRVQVYWPELVLNRSEFRLRLTTTLRLAWGKRIRGFGFQLFNFGCGISWEPAGIKSRYEEKPHV